MKNIHSLTDLEELLLMCRDQSSKNLLSEAVTSYKAGAYRSAIVSTWVALCFDFIQKLHELSLAGDKEAELLSMELNNARINNDLGWSLRFEKNLLATARDKFELISQSEYIDLERLLQDRNRCAHPSFSVDGEPYEPSAELARSHIYSTVKNFLQHPPMQGKAALARLVAEVESGYFPIDEKKAIVIFSNGALRKPRKSLLSNFITVLFKKSIQNDTKWEFQRRINTALTAVAKIHGSSFSEISTEKLTPILRNCAQENIEPILLLFKNVPILWPLVSEDIHQKMKSFVENLPNSSLPLLEEIEGFEPLVESSKLRLKHVSIDVLMEVGWFSPPKFILGKYITGMLSAKTLEISDSIARELGYCAPSLTYQQVEQLILGAKEKPEILFSHGFLSLLKNIKAGESTSGIPLNEIISKHSLIDFIQ